MNISTPGLNSDAPLVLFIRYLMTGVVNTGVGYSVFWVFWKPFGFIPEVANALGYAVALAVAFVLNKKFVFRDSHVDRSAIAKFIGAFAVAFAINQLILAVSYRALHARPEIAQLFAMTAYTCIFFLLNKIYVYKQQRGN